MLLHNAFQNGLNIFSRSSDHSLSNKKRIFLFLGINKREKFSDWLHSKLYREKDVQTVLKPSIQVELSSSPRVAGHPI